MPARKYTIESLAPVVAVSRSFRDLTIRLGVKPHGGSIAWITRQVRELGLDTCHFTGRKWYVTGAVHRRKPADVLRNHTTWHAHQLRNALRAVGVQESCGICGLTEWRGRALPLQVHHINGVRTDNRRVNLQFICPNCHAQTATYGFKGRKHK